jgi:PKD repeat protein
VATLAVLVTPALAASAGAATMPYGEVARFGGFGNTPGKFEQPVGFAVDPGDANAIYVLDLTNNDIATGELEYRLQKISSTGTHEVLGSTAFKESYTDKEFFTNAHPLISLAVDSSEHRIYALVEAVAEINTEEEYVPVAQKIVAWSTIPSSGKLVAAPGYGVDPLTGAGLVLDNLNSSEASKDLYAPEGLAVDPKDHDVVIEAQQGVQLHRLGGPTILQRVGTVGSDKGKLDGSPWVADATIAPPPAGQNDQNEQGDGLFIATNGESFGIDLYAEKYGSISRLLGVGANFATPSTTAIAPDASAGKNVDGAPTIDARYTVNYNSDNGGEEGSRNLQTYTAGSPVVQLSNEDYAARFGDEIRDGSVESDVQAETQPWNDLGPQYEFWTQGDEATKWVANEGVRIFDKTGDILATIGGGVGQCDLDSARIALAAGANETLFALDQPDEIGGASDNQVIEFAPGGPGACPVPSGQVTVNGTATSSATVTAGVPVEFNASSIDRAGGAPYEFDWDFGDATGGGALGEGYELGSKMAAPAFKWPNPVDTHTYTKAGVYKASLRMIGDYGTSVFPFEVKVLASKAPVAAFTTPTSLVAGQSATFDGSGSSADSSIVDYHWVFGDGSEKDTSVASVAHTFASAGTYEVKLTTTDEVGETATVSHSVTVTAASTSTGGGGGSGGGGGGSSDSTATGTTGATSTGAATTTGGESGVKGATTTAKALTKAQKLAAALKVCHKQPKKKRASCEREAKKRYGPPAKKKQSKKKK